MSHWQMGGAIEKIEMLVAIWGVDTLNLSVFHTQFSFEKYPRIPPSPLWICHCWADGNLLPALCSYASNYVKEDKIKVKYGYNWTTESSCSFENRFIEILVMDLMWVWLHASSWRKSDTQTISDQAKLGQIHFKVYPTNQFAKSNRLDISNHEIMLKKVHCDQTELACPTK